MMASWQLVPVHMRDVPWYEWRRWVAPAHDPSVYEKGVVTCLEIMVHGALSLIERIGCDDTTS